ncbi:MAG: hypothetical protein ACLP9L_10245 [Thermoguttaceae bacterium]|jgi:DNA-binding transcriptional MerR regulator
MNQQHYLLRDVAKRLGVKPYQIAYALSVGLVPEPMLRISNKRIFQAGDVDRLAAHFGVKLGAASGRREKHDE